MPDEIEQRFALESRVGGGAFGEVFRGHDRVSGAPVAIKRLVLSPNDAVAAMRFEQEARLLAQIQSPYVVRYLAHGVDRTGRPCLVLEWLDGSDLAARQRSAPLDDAQAIDVVRQGALGLAALHSAGVVHRDIKPANFCLVAGENSAAHARPSVKLIDLGIARTAAGVTLTVDGLRVGTPAYMSPEQARGDTTVGPASDVYSLGIVLYELLAGRRPFRANDPFAMLAKIVLQEPPPPSKFAPDVPRALEAIVLRAIAKVPEQRFATALEFAAALEAVAPGVRPRAVPMDEAEAPTAMVHESASSISTAEQRIVTAVFAAIPEGPSVERDADAFAALAASHGGVAHRTLGHRVVAVFGLARSTGTEPLRAARAALDARRAISGVRLAIATCRVRSGSASLSDDAIERGAGSVGTPGAAIPLDATSAYLLQAHFDVRDTERAPALYGEHVADDGVEPPRLFGRATPTVGREREIATLEALAAECFDEPVARVAIVTAPAGAGKSRLRFELLRKLRAARPEVELFAGRGDTIGAGSPFGLLASALRRSAGILGGEPADVQREKLSARVARTVAPTDVARVAAFVGEIAGVPFPDAAHPSLRAARRDSTVLGDAMRTAFEDWLARETEAHPVVLVLEDLHWGDGPTVQFVDAALRNLHDRPLFVLAFARPEAHDLFPRLWAERDVQQVHLAPLTRKASERLVRAALGTLAGDELVSRVVERGEGNAFHLEELARAVAAGRGELLPESVLGSVQARLDELGPGAKRVLRAASVFGRTFWHGALATVLGDQGAGASASVTEVLSELESREVVLRNVSPRFPGEDEYAFRHALVRDAAYAMLTDEDRAHAHALAAGWLEGAGEGDASVLAQHFERGGHPSRALVWYRRAIEQDMAGHDFAAVIARAERGIACGAAADDLGALRLLQAEAHRWRGELASCETAATAALDALAPGSALFYRALGEAAVAHARRSDYVALDARVTRWFDAAPLDRDAATHAASAGGRIAAQLASLGRVERAEEMLAMVEARSTHFGAVDERDPVVEARTAQASSLVALARGNPVGYATLVDRAIQGFRRAGDERNACMQRVNAGNALLHLGRHDEAEPILHGAHAAAARMNLRSARAFAQHTLGVVLGRLGRFDEARVAETESVEWFAAQGDRRVENYSRVYLSAIFAAAGNLAAAEREARLAVTSSTVIAAVHVVALAQLARVLLALGRADEALGCAGEAMDELARVGEIEEGEPLVRLAYAEALDGAGRRGDALEAIRTAESRLLERATRVDDGALRERFLRGVPEHARTMDLASAWKRAPA